MVFSLLATTLAYAQSNETSAKSHIQCKIDYNGQTIRPNGSNFVDATELADFQQEANAPSILFKQFSVKMYFNVMAESYLLKYEISNKSNVSKQLLQFTLRDEDIYQPAIYQSTDAKGKLLSIVCTPRLK